MSSIKSKVAERDFVGFIVAAFGINHVTPWEAGRKASLFKGVLADNPWASDSLDHSEWSRGFVHGCCYNDLTVINSEQASVVETLPAYPVEPISERTFWAAANNMQLQYHLSVDQLAGRLGVAADQVNQNMVTHQFYDENSIPLGNRVAI